jgi:hypothetical protein
MPVPVPAFRQDTILPLQMDANSVNAAKGRSGLVLYIKTARSIMAGLFIYSIFVS